MSTASIQRVWALALLLLLWAGLLAGGVAAILVDTPGMSLNLWPEPAHPTPLLAPRGGIYSADGAPLALSLQNGERVYPLGQTAGQVVGYVKGKRGRDGRINTSGEADAGQAGVEKAMEGRLARGENVYLTLDSKLQMIEN